MRGRSVDAVGGGEWSSYCSSVTIMLFQVELDGSKLPSSGCAPIGLGRETSGHAESLDEFESRRAGERRPVEKLLLGHGARLQLLEGVDPVELSTLEAENAAILDADTDGPNDIHVAPAFTTTAYTTALPGDERAGVGHGFEERQEEEEVRRKRRQEEEKTATQVRKAEKRRCTGCKRFACIC